MIYFRFFALNWRIRFGRIREVFRFLNFSYSHLPYECFWQLFLCCSYLFSVVKYYKSETIPSAWFFFGDLPIKRNHDHVSQFFKPKMFLWTPRIKFWQPFWKFFAQSPNKLLMFSFSQKNRWYYYSIHVEMIFENTSFCLKVYLLSDERVSSHLWVPTFFLKFSATSFLSNFWSIVVWKYRRADALLVILFGGTTFLKESPFLYVAKLAVSLIWSIFRTDTVFSDLE